MSLDSNTLANYIFSTTIFKIFAFDKICEKCNTKFKLGYHFLYVEKEPEGETMILPHKEGH